MICQSSLQLSPPRSLVTRPLLPLAPGDQLPQHAQWHRQQDSSSSCPPRTQASSTAPNHSISGSNYNLKSIVKASCSSHPVLGLEVQNYLLRKWLSAAQHDDVMARISSWDVIR